MTPGLKRSLAARAAASKNGNSESEQTINVRALLREIGTPGGSSGRAARVAEAFSALLAEMEPKVTVESNDTTAAHGNVGGCIQRFGVADLSNEFVPG